MVADIQITDALVEIRKEIDGVDLQIIELLLKRFNLARKAAAEKESLDLVKDEEREEQIIKSAVEYTLSIDSEIDENLIRSLFQSILAESRKQVAQEFIRTKGQNK